MQKYKHVIYLFIFITLLHLFNLEQVYAADHKLEKLHINVFIDHDGNARITETRHAELSEGTENFIIIGNLGESEIEDFVVKEDGEIYEFIEDWDVEASQSEKAYKNGIIKNKNGYELCWGIGMYGKHEYKIEYTVTNFIKQLQDSQILFWRFVNDQTNIPPEEVTVEIETEKRLSEDTEKIWGFGFAGNVEFVDGKVISTNNNPLDQDDYVTILVQFADGVFKTEEYIDKPFEEIKEEAFKGSDYGKEKRLSVNPKIFRNVIVGILISVVIFLNFYKPSIKLTEKKPRTFRRKYREEYYREYPYKGNFLDVYYLLYVMGASNFEKLFTAFILKWINEDRIIMDTKDVGFFSKNEIPNILFVNKEMNLSTLEGKLFHMMLLAAGSDDVLSENEFTRWAEKNRKKLIRWEKDVINESLDILEGKGFIELQVEKRFFRKRKVYESTETGLEFEKKVYQYVNYLHDFSLLSEHEAINVKIWDGIMIWAALLGKTDVVTRQLKKLYPAYTKETVYSGSTLYLTSSFSQSTSEARVASYSGGSGGSTSSGGGGGSFGGGSGGGTR